MNKLGEYRLSAVVGVIAVVLACQTAGTSTDGVTVRQLAAGDTNCPHGGAAITANGTTAYACSGAPGAAGTTGGGLYTSRDDVYCNVSGVNNGGNVVAACNTELDLPLSGSCEPSSVNAIVTESRPVGWPTFPGLPASWQCQFSAPGGGVIGTGTPGGAYICCVKHP